MSKTNRCLPKLPLSCHVGHPASVHVVGGPHGLHSWGWKLQGELESCPPQAGHTRCPQSEPRPKFKIPSSIMTPAYWMRNIFPFPASVFKIRHYAIHVCHIGPLHVTPRGFHIAKILRHTYCASSPSVAVQFLFPYYRGFTIHVYNTFPLEEIPEHGTIGSKVTVFKKPHVLVWGMAPEVYLPNNCFLCFRSVSPIDLGLRR